MWITSKLGHATCHGAEDKVLVTVRAAGGRSGVRLTLHHQDATSVIRLADDSGEDLPEIADSYARCADFVARLAQGENDAFGLTLQTRSVQSDQRALIVEWVVEMQTRLLESYPAVRLTVADASIVSRAPEAYLLRVNDRFLSILLTPRDQAACREVAPAEDRLALRIFGDFLEKGVIQKCRMWLIHWGEQQPDDAELAAALEQLNQSPLPLTT